MRDRVQDTAQDTEPGAGAHRPTTGQRAGAAMWLLQPLYVVAELAAAVAATAPYSLLDNTISDLGAVSCTEIDYPYGPVPVCSPWHPLVNGSFVVFGLLVAVGALLLRRRLPRGAMATTAVGLWVVSGLSSVATGLVPLDRDLGLHVLVSLPVFLAQPLALVATARALRRAGPHPGVARGTMLVGLGSLLATVVFLARSGSPDLGGLLERLALWPGYLWLPVLGWVLLRSRSEPGD